MLHAKRWNKPQLILNVGRKTQGLRPSIENLLYKLIRVHAVSVPPIFASLNLLCSCSFSVLNRVALCSFFFKSWSKAWACSHSPEPWSFEASPAFFARRIDLLLAAAFAFARAVDLRLAAAFAFARAVDLRLAAAFAFARAVDLHLAAAFAFALALDLRSAAAFAFAHAVNLHLAAALGFAASIGFGNLRGDSAFPEPGVDSKTVGVTGCEVDPANGGVSLPPKKQLPLKPYVPQGKTLRHQVPQ